MPSIPTGTVTFLFTDIEGSTKLAREHPETWETARERHHFILREAIETNHGFVFQIIGDAFCGAFHTAGDALKAAYLAQQGLQSESWGNLAIRVRMGIHTGEAEAQGNEYRGYLTLSLVQRIMSAGHGGQVLVSGATENLLRGQLPKDIDLRDTGKHNFKDVPQAVRVFQVIAPDISKEFPPLRTLDALPNNLPTQLTSFVGREKELADVKKLLQDTHILTLIGPGGTGKTRLSIQAASELLDRYPDGVWLVELAPIFDPLLVPRTTAIAIGLRDESQRPIIDMLCDYLREKHMLIVLDNCEHLVDACARMADKVLHATPNVRILASSREALGIAGEVAYRVPSLGLPDINHLPPVESLSQYEAVKLFIDRATSAVPTFTVTNDNALALAQTCSRLDGIPLAIELAAAKVRVLSVDQIAKRLDDRFKLLTGGSRTALERHQTLSAAIDWSYNLLPAAEQVLFKRLSVFVGGGTLEAIESVCSEESASSIIRSEDILGLLEQLINKSLVISEEAQSESRYHMLETIRQYANEKLVDSGESDTLHDKHLDYFLTLAETAEPFLRRTEQIEWLNRLDTEHENLRAALAWASEKPFAEPALRLSGALGMFWHIRVYWREGAQWLDWALSKESDEANKLEKAARAKVLYRRADLAEAMDELEIMRTSAKLALVLCEEVKDSWGTAYSRLLVAMHLQRMADYEASKPLVEQSLVEFQKVNDVWGEAFGLNLLQDIVFTQQNREEYFENQRRVLALTRASGDRYRLATLLIGYGVALINIGEWAQGEKAIQEADQLFTDLGSSYGINQLHWNNAQLFLWHGNLEEAKTQAKLSLEHFRLMEGKTYQILSLILLMIIAEVENDLDAAIKYQEESLVLTREIGEPDFIALNLALLGRLRYQEGHHSVAIENVQDSLRIVKKGGTGVVLTKWVLCQLGGFFVGKKSQVAVQLLGVTEALWRTSPVYRDVIFDKPYFERFLATAREKLSEIEFIAAWEKGLKMTVEEGIEFALKTLEEME